VRATEAQYSLSASERAKNLTEAFGIGKDFRRRPEVAVLLVDDIYTTGATAMSAMQTLNQAGMKVVGLAASAITLKV
jgi:predicted amidophosphoribosyltransferase